jgi:hypothetical protein
MLVFYFCYVCRYFTEDEIEDVTPNSGKLEFYLTVHQTSSCQTASVSVIFSFLQNVRCTLTHTVNQQIIIIIIIIIILFLKYYGSYEFLQVHSLTTTQGLPASCPSKPLRIIHAGGFSRCNASRIRKRDCVVVEDQALTVSLLLQSCVAGVT